MIRRLTLAAVAVAALASCSAEESPPPDRPSSAPSSDASTGTPVGASPSASSATPSADPGVRRLVVPAAAASLPPTWREAFVIPYGEAAELLGTSPGGDTDTLDIGPGYGAPGPDGSWWFLDAAKQRVAHYDAGGAYLGEVEAAEALGVTGFPWSQPHVLADGTLVAVRLDPPYSWLLRVHDGLVSEVRVDGLFSPESDDGELLYGSVGRGRYAVVDPTDGSRERTETFRTPAGTRFFIGKGFDSGRLRVELPDVGVSRVLPTRTASGAIAHVGAEVRAGADDVIHLFLVGTGEDDESAQLVGYTSVGPTGVVPAVEVLPNPFSASDPGGAAHLVVAAGSSTPMLVYVLEDGVHVYERAVG